MGEDWATFEITIQECVPDGVGHHTRESVVVVLCMGVGTVKNFRRGWGVCIIKWTACIRYWTRAVHGRGGKACPNAAGSAGRPFMDINTALGKRQAGRSSIPHLSARSVGRRVCDG